MSERVVMSESVVLGVIGGSGLYQMEGAATVAEHALDTPYGKPSDVIVEADIGGRAVYFLPRHGKGHKMLPCEVPARANIHALKQLGVTHVLAVSALITFHAGFGAAATSLPKAMRCWPVSPRGS